MSDFVIVVDVQRDFLLPDGALPVPGAAALAAPIEAWLAALDPAATAGVLRTFDTHDRETYPSSAEAAQFPLHCVRGTDGWNSAIDPAVIDPAIPLYRLEKGVFAMWEEPEVTVVDERRAGATPVPRDAFFDGLRADGIVDVTVIGVAADYCVRWAIDGLVERGFRVTVPAALTRGIDRQIGEVVASEWGGAVLLA